MINMKDCIGWLNAAICVKGITGGMNHYRVTQGEIRATDGRITAGYPWPYGGDFLVPGEEFEKVLNRMPTEPTLSVSAGRLTLRSGRFRGTVEILPPSEWNYPGCEDAEWLPIPKQLIELLKVLKDFISDNAVQQWALCVALQDGWAFSTNNIAIAGAPCEGLGTIRALLPIWAIEFLTGRATDLTHWCWTNHYCGFRWKNGAWMRSQLIVGEFPAKAASLVQQAFKEKPSQKITKEFRIAFERVAELAEDTIAVYADRIESQFGKATVEDGITCEVPQEGDHSLWGAKYLLPALRVADSWSPGQWPNPVCFRGSLVSGYVVGRRQ